MKKLPITRPAVGVPKLSVIRSTATGAVKPAAMNGWDIMALHLKSDATATRDIEPSGPEPAVGDDAIAGPR